MLLQIGLLLDHLDGTLARYRGTSSALGSYFDKVADVYAWQAISIALGWVVYEDTGNAALLLLAPLASFSLLVMGYIKWVYVHEEDRRKWRLAAADPTAAVARENARPASSGPPVRTRADWIRFIGVRLLRAWAFEEVDLFFWVGLFLVLDRLVILVWLLAVSQGVQVIGVTIRRAAHLAAFDRERDAR